jgi:outer membrane protein insertion porin family
MFAKQTVLSASLVVLCSAAPLARAEEGIVPAQGDGEVYPPSDDAPTSVEIEPPGDVAPTPVEREPLDVRLEPREPPEPATPPEIKPAPEPLRRAAENRPGGQFMFGAGYSQDEGVIVASSIAHDNLFRTGNQLSLDARLSGKRQLFMVRFADPDVFGTPLALSTDLYNDIRQLPGFTRAAVGSSLTLSYPIARNLRAFAGYRLEHVQVGDESLALPRTQSPMPPLASGWSSALRTGLVYSTLDNPRAPLTGTSFGASIEVADRRLGSELEFTRVQAWAGHHQPIGPFTLHLTGKATAITSPSPFGVPHSERLFLDSSSEIRGYRPDSFSPLSPFGTALGGDLKLVGSAELEVPLFPKIGLSAIAFVDAGGIYDRHGESATGLSAGFGLLWRTKYGVFRFSVAFPQERDAKPGFILGLGSGF